MTASVFTPAERLRHVAAPSDLLRPEAAIVPLLGRHGTLSGLQSWCVAPEPFGVRLLTSPGGLGKTRVARELVGRMERSGWVAGFLQPDRPGGEVDLRTLTGTETPVLLVVDYAETRVPQVARLLTTVWGSSDVAPVRLLLLARTAADWWKQLRLEYPDPLMTATLTSLAPLDTGSQDRIEAWRAALTALAARLPDLDPATDWASLPSTIAEPQDILDDRYGSPLNLQAGSFTACWRQDRTLSRSPVTAPAKMSYSTMSAGTGDAQPPTATSTTRPLRWNSPSSQRSC